MSSLPATIQPQTELLPANAFTLEDVEFMADRAAKSRFFPGVNSIESAFTLMMLAQMEGIHPMQALREYSIIQGRPAMRFDAMQAKFQNAGGSVEWVQTDAEVCEAIFTHPKTAPKGVKVRFTLEDAKRAKLLGKDNWQAWPANMLRARVISNGVRMVLPAVVLGIYTPDETEDIMLSEAGGNVGLPAPIPANSARSTTSAVAPSPVVAPPPAAEAVRLITQADDGHDPRRYVEIAKQEAEALSIELQKLDPNAKAIERFQLHRHILKAASAAGLIEPIAPGTKISNGVVVERCQDLYRSDREWVRLELATYTDRIYQDAKAAVTGGQAEAEDVSQDEPGANG